MVTDVNVMNILNFASTESLKVDVWKIAYSLTPMSGRKNFKQKRHYALHYFTLSTFIGRNLPK